ncbi:MAG: leucine-rich repeat domain-containing protein [Clostridiales bacterium]|jgi:hypothetical protein|nr:leucine-rich repeat domain-containing protein [Clostridiales bacterium]
MSKKENKVKSPKIKKKRIVLKVVLSVVIVAVAAFLVFAAVQLFGVNIEYVRTEGGWELKSYTVGAWRQNEVVTVPSEYKGEKVVAIGEYAFQNEHGIIKIVVPDSVDRIGGWAFFDCIKLKEIEILGDVKRIEEQTFAYDIALERVILPNSVTFIGGGAFRDCFSLKNIEIPKDTDVVGPWAFENCILLESVTIPENVTKLDYRMFSGCTSLIEVILPDGLTEIGYSAFSDCTALPSIIIPDGVTVLGGSAFSDCTELAAIILPDGLTALGDSAFRGCTKLASVVLSDEIKTLDNGVFLDCVSLKSLVLPSGLEEIGYLAFSGSGLVEIDIPDGVKSIWSLAFTGCFDLEEIRVSAGNTTYAALDGVLYNRATTYLLIYPVGKKGAYTMPNTVTEIDSNAFGYNENLKSITLSNNIGTSIWHYYDGFAYVFKQCVNLNEIQTNTHASFFAVDGVLYWQDTYGESVLCYFPQAKQQTEFTVPDSTVGMASYAFYNARYLEKIVFSENCAVQVISYQNFYGCTSLKSIEMSDEITEIGSEAFYGCTSLKRVDLPAKLITIGSDAFYNCSALTSVTLPDGLKTIGVAVFCGCSSLKSISIPDSVESIGSDAFWKSGIWDQTPDGQTIYIGSWAIGYKGDSYVSAYNINDIMKGDYTIKFEIREGTRGIAGGAFHRGNGSFSPITSLRIPESVLYIGDAAFGRWYGLKSLNIPNGVRSIGSSAFMYCEGLIDITIGAGTTEIGSNVFSGCFNLERVTVDGQNMVYCSADGVLYDKEKTMIIYYPFAKRGAWIIPEGVTDIDDSTNIFENNNKITSITIPSTLISWNYSRLSYHYVALTDIHVSVDNPVYWSAGGVLYSGDTLLVYPRAKTQTEFTVPDGILYIADRAFYLNGYIKKVILPDGLLRIGSSAFDRCSALSEINIPDSVTWIGDYAFSMCDKLIGIELPDSITHIGSGAFSSSNMLYENGTERIGGVIYIGNWVIGYYATDGLLEIRAGTRGIADGAFSASWRFTGDCVIPESVEYIGTDAFRGWTDGMTIYVKGKPENYTGWGDWLNGVNTNIVWDA